MSKEQPGQIVKLHRSIKKILALGIASGLLITFCSFVIFTGIAQGNTQTTSINPFVAQATTTSPAVAKATASIAKPTPIVIEVNTQTASQSNPQDNFFILILISLLSGSVGAIFGSVIGAKINNKGLMNATEQQKNSLFEATERQISSLFEQERANRKYAEEQQQQSVRQALLAEIKENMQLASNINVAGAPTILSREAWDIYKGNIGVFPVGLQAALLNAYTEIQRCNSLVKYDRLVTPYGHGSLTPAIRGEGNNVAEVCQRALEELEKKRV